MNLRCISIGSVFSATLMLAGCSLQHYQAAPITPATTAAQFEERNLADKGLRAYLEKNLVHPITEWPPKVWNLRTLSLAALYFNPEMEAARARVAEADSAIVTAGARPNPTLGVAPGVPSPYLFNLDLAIPIETAGKRRYRLESARAMDASARFDLADSAWKVRSAVRSAMLDYDFASRTSELLRGEQVSHQNQIRLLQGRFSVGEIARGEVSVAEIELQKTNLALTTSDNQISEARVALAAAIGIPTAALKSVQLSSGSIDTPPSAEVLSPNAVQRDAVLNRMDVRRALAQYAAAEADLRLQIAKQYPDFEISPGYTYEERNNFFTIGLATTLPIFSRNQGPIAEAEARRKEAGAAFLQKQAQAIAESEQALVQYGAARDEYAEADQSLRYFQEQRLQPIERAVALGEDDRVTLSLTQIEASSLAEIRLTKLAAVQTALGRIEDAVQRPLDPEDSFSEDADIFKLGESAKETTK